jgi:hypothetical protein
MAVPGFARLTPVLAFLREPREKVFGVLLGLDTAGVSLRALDLEAVEDFLRQETRGDDERLIAPATVFYPMQRVERLEHDESVGPMAGLAERFTRETGRTLPEVFGVTPDE